MKFIILLGLFLLLSANSIGFAKDEKVAYEFKQASRLYGPSDCILDGDRARIDVPNMDVQIIFLEALDKVQIVNVKQHKTATISLQRWAKDGPPVYDWLAPVQVLPAARGKDIRALGLRAVAYRGGPDKPTAFDPGRFGLSKGSNEKDVWFYSEATFCNEFVLSNKMNQFVTGFFRLGQEKHLYPLRKVDYCKSGPATNLQTTAVIKIDPHRYNISFVKGYREVSLTDVTNSARKDEFATELVNGFSLGKNK